MSTAEQLTDHEADAARWDLLPLLGDHAGLDQLLRAATTRVERFVQRYRGRLAELDGPGLTEAMRGLGEITDLATRAEMYAELTFAADSRPVENGALTQKVKEALAAFQTQLLFFELEWNGLEDERAQGLLDAAGPELEFAAHHLRTLRSKRPYLLSEPEERILAERRITGEQAWARLFEERDSSMEVELDGEMVPFAIAYNDWYGPSAQKRRDAVAAMSASFVSEVRTRAYIYNTLLHDKAVEDRLRGYPTWLSRRNLENQVDDASVQALIAAVRSRYDIPQRWYRTKAALMGFGGPLPVADQFGPLFEDETTFSYAESRELVLSAYHQFSPQAGEIVSGFFDGGWIDAAVRPGKASGAFCGGPSASVHPYVMLNHGGHTNDVLTMAHELGHGLHDVLAGEVGVFHWAAPLTLAETASTFGESLTLDLLLSQAPDDRTRLGLLTNALDGSMATIFRQVVFNQFEERTHNRRRTGGELSADEITAIMVEADTEMHGGTIEMYPGFDRFWCTVPHMFLWPGYVYAYAYGQLLSLSLYARYKETGPDFIPRYMRMLAAGGSMPPVQIGQIVGVDLSDPEFWASGLDLVDGQLRAIEELAPKLA